MQQVFDCGGLNTNPKCSLNLSPLKLQEILLKIVSVVLNNYKLPALKAMFLR